MGTGFGLRYDLTFIVIRFDVGIGLHLPYDTGKKGYYNIPKFKDGMVTTSLSDTPSSCSIPRILWSYPRYFIFNRSTLIGNEILLRSHFNNKQIN